MKELVTRWIQRRALDSESHYFLKGKDQLTDLGKIYFQRMFERIKKGEQTPLSEYFGVLSGFKFSLEGSSFLEGLRGKGALFLENHTPQGPISGHWKLFATNYLIKKMTGKEIRWISEGDKSTSQRVFQDPIIESLNAIPVEEGKGIKGIKLIQRAFLDQGSVGLYPEGYAPAGLIRGNPKAGGIILYAAEKDIPIIAASAWFEKDKNVCHLSFTPLDNEFIKSIASKSSDRKQVNRKQAKQEIVDYAMAEIAQKMPRELRGEYKNFPATTPLIPAK